MKTIVINTGTELLLGDVLNTHLSFIARKILPFGLRIDRQETVPDGEAIERALLRAFSDSEITIVTGGLGPTTDDLTREITARLLGLELRQDPKVLSAITARMGARGFRITDRIPRQADVPAGAVVLPNENGTAPGLYLQQDLNAEKKSPHLFLLPGPPRELHPMFAASVIPILRDIVPDNSQRSQRVYHIVGMGESLVEEAIGEKLATISDLELGYCAHVGAVDLRIIGSSSAVTVAESIIESNLAAAIVSGAGENIEKVVLRLLTGQKKTIAVAESCTGGLLAHRITNVPGASAVFLFGAVTYSNEAKINSLGVAAELIEKHGAVSEPVARAMAEGACKSSGANFALATTGVAGPDGGTPEKPVGTVFVALAEINAQTKVHRYFFPEDRATFKQLATQRVLDLLRRRLLGKEN